MRFTLSRLLGVATAAYGVAVLVKPALLLKPSGLRHGDHDLDAVVRTLAARDLASGIAMAVAPSRKAMRLAIGVRVASDVGDAVVLSRALAGRPEQKKILAVAGGWGLACALSALTTRK
ncbi:hypothetical protein [Actinophytocola sp.]|uniref:hypothetical protein n=1 Tax=Actinophytocola sp. TaxID=1872138 RepID=UPI002D4FC2F9|nr:hypothetical protein [Actinophytocola sp.]HYQ62808.1 hypothetical protein [Actinophytocola sp.]